MQDGIFTNSSFSLLKLHPEQRAGMLNIIELDSIAHNLCSLPGPGNDIPARFRSGVYAVYVFNNIKKQKKTEKTENTVSQICMKGTECFFELPPNIKKQQGVVLFDSSILVFNSEKRIVKTSVLFDSDLHSLRITSHSPLLQLMRLPICDETGFVRSFGTNLETNNDFRMFHFINKGEGHGFVTLLANCKRFSVMELGTHTELAAYVPQITFV
ncbi:MAG: hypothetical protein ABII22_03345 [Candidatus Micrarchaeota archaeon]